LVCIKAKKNIADPLSIWRESSLWDFYPFLFWALQALYYVHM
jgi:hypothetical protein